MNASISDGATDLYYAVLSCIVFYYITLYYIILYRGIYVFLIIGRWPQTN